MDYPLEVPGFSKEPLWIKKGFGSAKLMLGETETKRGEGALERVVINDNGQETVATIKGRLTEDPFLPAIVVDGEEYAPTPPIPGGELFLGFAPMILALTSGIWGAVMGIAAVLMNFPILRSGRPAWQRIGLILGIFVLAIAGTQVLNGITNP